MRLRTPQLLSGSRHGWGLVLSSIVVPGGQAALIALIARGLTEGESARVFWLLSVSATTGVLADFGLRNTVYLDWREMTERHAVAGTVRRLLEYKGVASLCSFAVMVIVASLYGRGISLTELLLWGVVAGTNYSADLGTSIMKGRRMGLTVARVALLDRSVTLVPLLALMVADSMTTLRVAFVLATAGAARTIAALSMGVGFSGSPIGASPEGLSLRDMFRRNAPAGLSILASIGYLRSAVIVLPWVGGTSLIAPLTVALSLREVGTTVGRLTTESAPAKLVVEVDRKGRAGRTPLIRAFLFSGLVAGGVVTARPVVTAVFDVRGLDTLVVFAFVGVLLVLMSVQSALRMVLVGVGRGYAASILHGVGVVAVIASLVAVRPTDLTPVLAVLLAVDVVLLGLMIWTWRSRRLL